MKVQEENRIRTAEGKVKEDIREHIEWLRERIEAIEREIEGILMEDEDVREGEFALQHERDREGDGRGIDSEIARVGES